MFSFYLCLANAAAVASDECFEKLISNAIKVILGDKGFEIPSSNASDAVSTANSLLKWKQSNSVNQQLYFKFCSSLINSLSKCLPKGTAQAEREKMWENFHKLTTSVPFIDLWNGFLKSTQCSCKPIFYQFITTEVFKEMI